MSNQSSSAFSLWLPPLLWMALIFSLSSVSSFGPLNRLGLWMFDKIAHMGIYGMLGFLLSRAAHQGWNWKWKQTALFAVVISSIYGVTDEWHQSFVPGRSVEAEDWAADTLGAVLAQVVYYYFYFLKSLRR